MDDHLNYANDKRECKIVDVMSGDYLNGMDGGGRAAVAAMPPWRALRGILSRLPWRATVEGSRVE
jgi:hypothetical protein